MAPDLPALEAAIRNDAWMVRHYQRQCQRMRRQQAIRKLGLTVRHAFNSSDDFEPLLVALFDGLNPNDSPPPF